MSAEQLIQSFASEFGFEVTEDTRFGSASLGVDGTSDGAPGVQWNAWVDLRRNGAYMGVNLEGLKYDVWPIARFIERELDQLQLFDVVPALQFPELIEVMWYRDAWQFAARPRIEEGHIGVSGCRLSDITREQWRQTLAEAYECLDTAKGHRGRGRQVVTVKGRRVEYDVSPHLQFRRVISTHASSRATWGESIREARLHLKPLFEYVQLQARP